MATGAVLPPFGDHAHRIRTTVPYPPGYGIGQLADGRGRPGRDDGGVEIRIVLDRAEPPAGRLRVVRAPGQDPGTRAGQEVGFTGWLGLLRALYEVTAGPDQGVGPMP
jgi:hypothetical protein